VVIRLLLPRLPLILKTALFNALSLSRNSSQQTVTTEVAVVILRSMLEIRKPMHVIQKIGLKDPGITGPLWISQVTIPAPVDELGPWDAVMRAIQALGDGTETYTRPESVAVEGEWTGYRSGVSRKAPRLDLSEEQHYQHLMAEVSSPVTILYFHGGAFFVMDPASHRHVTSRLAKSTRGRCFSVRYRLAPQHPFPAQLLDALTSYLFLLSPPPEAFHDAVPAKHVVFAGDSAGGNLSLALLQLLLTLRRSGLTSIRFHGVDVPLDLPAGVAVNSPWVDIARSLPSIHANAHLDYLQPPSATGIPADPMPDALWPTSPPRAEIYCEASVMMHPLVSPLAAAPRLWEGMPPVFMCLGNEGLEDEITALARRMYQANGAVQLVGYEGMPHCFALIFPTSAAGKDCFKRWSQFCVDAVEGKVERRGDGLWMKAFSHPLHFTKVTLEDVGTLNDEEVDTAMRRMKQCADKRESEALGKWKDQQSKARL